MTRLIFADGYQEDERSAITAFVATLGARSRHKPLPGDALTVAQLADPDPDRATQAALLKSISTHLADWLPAQGHGGCDLVVFAESQPNLPKLREKFRRIHRHADDEVRYILAGTGYFGFVLPGGGQALLEVSAGDYLNVPRGAEHWFALGRDPRLKAVRYFGEQPRWSAQFSPQRVDPRLDPGKFSQQIAA